MKNLDSINILYYCIFTMFIFYQQLHLKNFQGSSKIFEFVLSISTFGGMIVGLVYLIMYGIRIVWWAPFIIFFISVLFGFISVLVEKLIGSLIISLIGFIGWPLFAIMMFSTMPTSPKQSYNNDCKFNRSEEKCITIFSYHSSHNKLTEFTVS